MECRGAAPGRVGVPDEADETSALAELVCYRHKAGTDKPALLNE